MYEKNEIFWEEQSIDKFTFPLCFFIINENRQQSKQFYSIGLKQTTIKTALLYWSKTDNNQNSSTLLV